MTRPLGPVVRGNLEAADDSPAWPGVNLETMRMQVEALRDAYPMADIRLAQFLVETAMGIENALKGPDKNLRENVTGYQVSLMLLASAVSRKVRGKPEV